jgi:IPT/TIG domain-containing protein
VPAPVVTGVSPATGPLAGLTPVTVTGSGFTNATGVRFGTVAATNLAVAGDTQLTVTSPPATASGAVDVTVTTPGRDLIRLSRRPVHLRVEAPDGREGGSR